MGGAIGENSTFLADQLIQEEPDLKLVHIVDTKELCYRHQESGRCAYRKWSVKGLIATIQARIIITSNSKRDVNRYFVNGAVQINLWHGSPIKKIMCDDHLHPLRSSALIKLLFPYRCGYNYDYTLCSGRAFIDPLKSAFKISPQQLLLANSPKCVAQNNAEDLRGNDKFSPYKNQFMFLFAPTFRDYETKFDPFADSNIDFIGRELKRLNIVMVIKSHFAAEKNHYKQDNIIEYSELFGDLQINLAFNTVDALITDYSGVYFDFLLTGKPIILAPVDYQEYLANGRKLYFDYSNFPCDHTIDNWTNFFDIAEQVTIEKSINNDKYKMTKHIDRYLSYQNQSLAQLIIEKFSL